MTLPSADGWLLIRTCLQSEIAGLQAEVQELRTRNAGLEEQVVKLEAGAGAGQGTVRWACSLI